MGIHEHKYTIGNVLLSEDEKHEYINNIDAYLHNIELNISRRLHEEEGIAEPKTRWSYEYYYLIVSRYTEDDLNVALELLKHLETLDNLWAQTWSRAVKEVQFNRYLDNQLILPDEES